MKFTTPTRSQRQAFTLIEALVVIALLEIIVGMIPCSCAKAGPKAARIKCASNLKTTSQAFMLFAQDHGGHFPFETTGFTDQGLDRLTWTQFLVLSNELGSAKVLLCPGDARNRKLATSFGSGPDASPESLARLQNNAVSYFIGVGAKPNTPNAILAGDCNIAPSRSAPPYSSRGSDPFVSIATYATWATNFAHHDWAGNLALADGSVQQVTESGLRAQLIQAEKEHGTNVNRFVFPQ